MLQKIFNSPPGPAPVLIAGLGNPGREYRENRHNMGFMLVDRLAQALSVLIGKVQFKALTGSGQYSGHKVILAKPQTYMNLSGQSISGLVRFYKIPLEQILVAHDDLDLPLGTLRIRPGGGSGGQKGIASTIEQLGAADFARMRIGIGRPPGQMDAADYVLQNFRGDEREIAAATLERAVKAAQAFIERGLDTAMNLYNGGQKEG
jgi:peptidyl-tRNA hydrolase, PTH1 family